MKLKIVDQWKTWVWKQGVHGSVRLVMKSEQRLILKEMLSSKYKRDPAPSSATPPLNAQSKGNRKLGTRKNCLVRAGWQGCTVLYYEGQAQWDRQRMDGWEVRRADYDGGQDIGTLSWGWHHSTRKIQGEKKDSTEQPGIQQEEKTSKVCDLRFWYNGSCAVSFDSVCLGQCPFQKSLGPSLHFYKCICSTFKRKAHG